jgi:VIT1/CCC1 family predicted Fe2+/Mn2+ transporter
MDPKRILPFEIKTTQFTQMVVYLWIPLLMILPIFIAKEIRVVSYLIAILLLMIVFLSFFLATQSFLKKDRDEEF